MADAPADVSALVDREVASIADDEVREALRRSLVAPERHLRQWDHGGTGEELPCWTVAVDVASDTAIVYSEHGFGPKSPWGLVSMTTLWFGMDSGWFRRLEDAFVDSFLAGDLAIWNVVERLEGQSPRVVVSSVTMDEAFARQDELSEGKRRRGFHVEYRARVTP